MDAAPRNEDNGWLPPEATRSDWENLFLVLMRPLIERASPGRAMVPLPGRSSRNGPTKDGLEAFARPLWMAGPWLSTHPTGRAEVGGVEQDIAAFYRDGIKAGTDPAHPESWEPLLHSGSQAVVEAPPIALSLWLARAHLWEPLDGAERDRVLAWLARVAVLPGHDNNWRLFSVLVMTICKLLGGRYDQDVIDNNLDRVESWYLGDGWYNDGPIHGVFDRRIDFYNAYVLHPYLLYWAWLDGDSNPARRTRIVERATVFQDSFMRWFAADGSFPCFGRSTLYRAGVLHAFVAAVVTGHSSLPLGQVRRLCSRTVSRSLTRPGVVTSDHRLTLGFSHEFLPMLEPYSGPGSPYWAAKAFGVLGLPSDHAFWQEVEVGLPVEQGDYNHAAPSAGWLVHGHQASGHVQVVNGMSNFGRKKYTNLSYSSHFGYEIDDESWSSSLDAIGEGSLTLSRDGRRWRGRIAFRCLAVHDDLLITEALYLFGKGRFSPRAIVLSAVKFVGDGQLRVHRVQSRYKVSAREGGYACGYASEDSIRSEAERASFVTTNDVTSAIAPLEGYDCVEAPVRSDRNVLAFNSLVPHVSMSRKRRGRFTLASVLLARPAPFSIGELFHGDSLGSEVERLTEVLAGTKVPPRR